MFLIKRISVVIAEQSRFEIVIDMPILRFKKICHTLIANVIFVQHCFGWRESCCKRVSDAEPLLSISFVRIESFNRIR